jgi:predicted MFS family arabinose efflux permease
MGIIGAAFGLGFIFGPAIGGFLSRWGYAAPAWFAAALSIANFAAALILLPESKPADRGPAERVGRIEVFRRALDRPHLPQVLLVFFLVITSFSSFENTFALYSERRFDFNAQTIGYMFAWIGVVLATIQGGVVGRVDARFGEHRIVPAALLLMAVSLALIAFSPTVPVLAVVTGLLAVGMGFNSPSIMSAISQLADPKDQGSTLGLSQSLGSLARIIGPMWGGFVFDHFGIGTPFVTAGALMLVAWTISLVAFRDFRPGPRAAD